MNKIILLLISFFIIAGCGKQTNKVNESTKQKPDSITKIEPKRDTIHEEANSSKGKNNEVKLLDFSKSSIPSGCDYKGNVIEGARWTDKNGENILIISQTKPVVLKEDNREQYIYAYCYTRSDDKYNSLWSITDHAESPCDLHADYLPGTLEIKDINGDGIAESTFLYKLDERCDVSPVAIKLMMHSGSTKLVIRGTTRVNIGNGQMVGGEKNIDTAFDSVPASLKKYASEKWDAFLKSYKEN
jgi:hypothetical protein